MPSLALVIHLINIVDGVSKGLITFDAVLAAISWVKYLEQHARRIYGLATNMVMQSAHRLSKKILDGSLMSPFSLRDIYRKQWAMLDDKEIVRSACDELVDAGWLVVESMQSKVGRSKSPSYFINPKIRIGA